MKEIKITESSMNEALTQIDALGDLTPKDRGCLRLLAEEMFAMCKKLLGTDTLDFEIKRSGKSCVLRVVTRTMVDELAREHFLSISTSGKNAASQGIKGILGTVLETLTFQRDPELYDPAWSYGMYAPTDGYACMWTLSRYLDRAPQEDVGHKWDEMEKSIIANFADDVSIGVRSGKLEMTVTKTF